MNYHTGVDSRRLCMLKKYLCTKLGDGLSPITAYRPNILDYKDSGLCSYEKFGQCGEDIDGKFYIEIEATEHQHNQIKNLDGVEIYG